MMREIRLLTLLELRGLYGFNKFRHTKDKKEKRRYILLGVAWALLGAMIFFYTGLLVYGLSMIGLSKIVPALLAMIASLIILFFGIFKAGGAIFGGRGDEMLSFPIRQFSIVASRFLSMYFQDIILTLAVFLPGAAVYGWCARPGAGFYIALIPEIIVLPLLPLAISTALGALITAVSARMKHRSIVQTILGVGLVLIVLPLSFTSGQMAESITIEMIFNLAGTINGLIENTYPPAAWFGAGVQGDWGRMILLVAVSLAAAVAMIAIVARYFADIRRRLNATNARHDYHMGAQKSSGLMRALYRREFKRYFSSSTYVTNTIVGPIMACMMSAAALFADVGVLAAVLPVDLAAIAPFLLAAVFTMMTTTAVSISMEGKQVWIIKTLPVPTKAILDSKILLNLSLMAPFFIISEILLAIALKPDPLDMLWMILIPALLILFAVVAGISINLKLHSFDWEKEEAVVKQSGSSALGGFAGFLVSLTCGAAAMLLPWGAAVRIAMCILLAAVTWILYQANNRVGLHTL